jgi:hypothetical protein
MARFCAQAAPQQRQRTSRAWTSISTQESSRESIAADAGFAGVGHEGSPRRRYPTKSSCVRAADTDFVGCVGGTGLEPVTSGLSSRGNRSRQFALVHFCLQTGTFPVVLFATSAPERTLAADIADTESERVLGSWRGPRGRCCGPGPLVRGSAFDAPVPGLGFVWQSCACREECSSATEEA